MSILRPIWPAVRRWMPLAIVAVLLYLLVAAVNPTTLWESLKRFDWLYLLPLVGSYLLYIALRAARWHLLMKLLHAPNSLTDSLLLFTAAQSAVLIPAGQFFLPVLQKSQHGTLIRSSAATVLVQELIFGLLVLPAALPGLPGYQLGGWLLLAAFILSVGAGAVILHDGIANVGLFLLELIPFLRHHIPGFRDLRAHIVMLMNTWEAVLGSALDLAAISVAATGFYITLVGLGQGHVGWLGAIGTYAFGNAVATLSALPGGLGANEDVSTAVLSHMGIAPGPAAAVTLIYRAVTLIVGTVIGWLVLFVCRHRFNMAPNLTAILATIKQSASHVHGHPQPVPVPGLENKPQRGPEGRT